ncbi:MAG: hypothetical protein M9895_05085 [Aquamicrobium sp.]|uniref:hypothetical protein n=1 Tax=Aquamicrobium sp. TaxID=1872579 RepID=UPI00349EBB9D|nr:hypothetical protein [Aquamicrobium sp.]MCO5158965.1 hypothetical protein [Aquamicrobium sp.]
MWHRRTYSADDAARLCGVSRNHLDVILHRSGPMIDLVSEKVGRNRLFAPADIAVIAVAHQIERAGRSWLQAIGIAFEHLEDPPPIDAILVAPVPGKGCGPTRIIADRDVSRLQVDRPLILIPIGAICASINGGAHVAL